MFTIIGHALQAWTITLSAPVVLHTIWLHVDITSIPVHFDELWMNSVLQKLIRIENPELLLGFPREAMFVTKPSLCNATVQLLCEYACVEFVMSNIRADTWRHSYTRCPEISGFRATLRVQLHSFQTAKFAVLCCRLYISTCSELVLCTYVLLLDDTGSNLLYCVE
jgi:hypothetical protein